MVVFKRIMTNFLFVGYVNFCSENGTFSFSFEEKIPSEKGIPLNGGVVGGK